MITRKSYFVSPLWPLAGSLVAVVAATTGAAESYDARSQAELLAIVSGQAPVQRQGVWGEGVSGGRDAVLYALHVDPNLLPLRFVVELTRTGEANDSFDPYLRLLNSDGSERFANDDAASGTRNAKLDFILTSGGDTGTFYIGISDALNPRYDVTKPGSGRTVDAHGSYVLSVRSQAVEIAGQQYEPNDTIADATFMGNGSFNVTPLDDAIGTELDVDIYKISLLEPALVHAEVREDDPGWEVGVFDPLLRLRNCTAPQSDPAIPDPCDLGTADDSLGLDAGAAVSTVLFEPQDLYIMVSGSPNRGYDPTVAESGVPGSVGFYELSVFVTPFDPTGPFEPNDSIPTAAVLPELMPARNDQVETEAFLGDGPFAPTRGDRDFFEFALTGGARELEIVLAAASIGSPLEAVVTLYDRNGTEIARREAIGGPEDLTLSIPGWCAGSEFEPEPIVVMVSAVGQRPPDDLFYPIPDGPTVVPDFGGAGSTGAYRLTLRTGSAEPELAVEPNDTIPTAVSTGLVNDGIYVGQSFMGDSECDAFGYVDVDMWSFVVSEPPVVLTTRISLCDDSGYFATSYSGYSFRLFDGTGEQLALHPVRLYDCPTTGETFQMLLTEPRTYFLGVASGYTCQYDTVYDPFEACTHEEGDEGPYHISMTLSHPTGRRATCTELQLTSSDSYGQDSLFVSVADGIYAWALQVNSMTGLVEHDVGLPGVAGGGSEGLAYDGRNVYFMEGRKYPRVYRHNWMNWTATYFGSGYFSDLAELGGKLFLLDYMENAIHVMDARDGRFVCTMPVGDTNGISLSGGLAALAGPNRLYAGDAFNTRNVYELSMTGAVTNVLTPMTKRPIALGGIGTDGSAAGGDNAILALGDWEENGLDLFDRSGQLIDVLDLPFRVASCGGNAAIAPYGDFDSDGDLDLNDAALLQRCFGQPTGGSEVPCAGGDVNSDGWVDLFDVSGYIVTLTGP